MNKRFCFALFLCATFLWLGSRGVGAEVDLSLSESRLAVLEKLMGAALAKDASLEIGDLVKATSAEFKKSEPCLQAAALPALISEQESKDQAFAAVNAASLEEFPQYSYDEMKKKAAVIYPMYKEGQTVTVKYMKSPRLSETVTGIYMGTRGGNIIVNSRPIRMGDMEGIVGNDGPDGEIVKFDSIRNQRLRQEWIDEYISSSVLDRKKFVDAHEQEYQDKQVAADFLLNQRNGYTFWDGQWFSPDALLQEFASNAVALTRRANAVRENELRARANAQVGAQLSMTSQSYAMAPVGKLPNVDGILAKQAEAERKRQELAEQKAKEEEELKEREAEESRQAELAAQRASQPAVARQAEPAAEVETSTLGQNKMMLYGVIGVVAICVIALVAWSMRPRGDKPVQVEEFYKSKGEFQEGFWATAEADPEGFKYVAYLFDNVDEAKSALSQLSFVSLGVDGELKSKRGDIILGAYKHQDRAVAVIGGTTLNYARWREASMTWPELPNAAYFRQSPEPKVKLVMPSAEELSHQEGLKVEKLGVEDVRIETGEINRVFRYRCNSRENALRFLALFKVEEEGIVVRVETPEGEFGKDLNGVFSV